MITELIRAKVKLSENSQNLTIPRIKKVCIETDPLNNLERILQ